LQKQVEEQQVQITSLQLQLNELRKMTFGSRAEKFIGANTNQVQQPDLFPDDKLPRLDDD